MNPINKKPVWLIAVEVIYQVILELFQIKLK